MFDRIQRLLATAPLSDEADDLGKRPGQTDRAVADGGTASASTVDPAAVADATDTPLGGGTAERLAAALSERLAGPDGEEAARNEVVTALSERGAGPADAVNAHGPIVDRVVDRRVADDETAAALKADLRAVLDDAARGADAVARDPSVAPGTDLGLGQVLDAVPHSTFLIAEDHTVLAYNEATADQLDIGETESLGEDCRESIAAATYSDGRRHDTLADKVAEAPRTADEEYDVDRIGGSYAFGDQIVYEDRSVMNPEDGPEQHISFQAMPLFDDGECVGILELVKDRSEEVRQQQAVEQLVTEVCETLAALADGDFTARAAFEGDESAVDDELLRIVTQVNAMIADFEELIAQVGEETTSLAESIAEAAEAAADIDRRVTEQNDSLARVGDEMESFSATMEQVAASASQVSDAADGALEEAERGREAGVDAREATDEVLDTSRELVDTVDDLADSMAEIEEVTGVIADVADQTNLLALNANIEAARSDGNGEGFAVVADEIKTLADETRSHTEAIADQVEEVQTRTDRTVTEVQRSYERVRTADERIEAAVDSLRAIADTVDDAAGGIEEVAEANDNQAATVEEVLGTVTEARQGAERVEEAVGDIVAETERQQKSVRRLTTQVDSLADER